MSLLDDVLAGMSNEGTSANEYYPSMNDTPEPSKYDSKVLMLEEKDKKKKIEIDRLAYQPDADSPVFMSDVNNPIFNEKTGKWGTQGNRTDGRDNYEVNHGPDYNTGNAKRERHMNNQREMYERQFGKSAEDVTDMDIYKQGSIDNLNSYYERTKAPDDVDKNGIKRGEKGFQEWEHGPISPEWYDKKGASTIGIRPTYDDKGNIVDEGSPLMNAIGRRSDGSDAYGRDIVTEYNINDPKNIVNLNDRLQDEHNTLIFDESTGRPDWNKTNDRVAELRNWKGTVPSKMNQEEIAEYKEWVGEGEGGIANMIDASQASSAKYAAKTMLGQGDMVGNIFNRFYGGEDNKMSEDEFKETAIGSLLFKLSEFGDKPTKEEEIKLKAQREKVNKDFLGTGLTIEEVAENKGDILDQKYGVSREVRGMAHALTKAGQKDWENEEYVDWFIKRFNGIPMSVADSAGPMFEIMSPGGSLGFTAAEARDQELKFEENNNRKMTNSEYLQMVSVTYGTTVVDKLLTMFGLGKLGEVIKSKSGKTLLGKLSTGGSGLAIAVATEIPQEASEAIREEMTTRKLGEDENMFLGEKATPKLLDVATSSKVWEQGATAGMAAGAMAGTGMAAVEGTKLTGKGIVALAGEVNEYKNHVKRPLDEDIEKLAIPEGYKEQFHANNDLFHDFNVAINEWVDKDNKVDTVSIDIPNEEAILLKHRAINAVKALDEVEEVDVAAQTRTAGQIYNTLFGEYGTEEELNLGSKVFKNEEDIKTLEAIKENLTEKIEMGRAEYEAQKATEVIEEEEVDSEEIQETDDAIEEAREHEKSMHMEYAQPFNESEHKKDMKKSKKKGDFWFIQNPTIRKEYEDKYEGETGKVPKSRPDTITDLRFKKKFIEEFGEVVPEPTTTEETTEEVIVESTVEETKEDTKEDKSGTQNDTIEKDDDTPFGLGAMDPKVKKQVKFEPIENESGSLIKKKAGKRKTEKRVAGLINDKSFLDYFMYGSREAKGEESLKHASQQRNSNKKATLKERESFLNTLHKTIVNGLESADPKTKKDFDILMANTDGSKKSVDGMGAVAGRLAVIAIDKIIDDIKSNVDRTINEKALPLGDMYANRQNINKEIGKAFVESYGQQAIPATENSEDSAAVNRYLSEVGNVAIEIVKDMGYINYLEEGQNIFDTGSHSLVSENNRDMTNEKDAAKESKTEELMGTKVPLLYGAEAIMMTDAFIGFKGIAGNESSADVQSDMSPVIASIMKALLPANKRDPEHLPSRANVQARGHKNPISPIFNDTVKSILQSKPLVIRGEVSDLLQDVAFEMKTNGRRVGSLLRQKKYAWLKNMFDLHLNDNVAPAEELSEKGQHTNRLALAESVMQMFMDNMDDNGEMQSDFEKVYFTYFKALNERAHVDEIPFNFQADNFFSRHALATTDANGESTSSSYDIDDRELRKKVNTGIIEAVAEELGVFPEEVMGQDVEGGSENNILDGIDEIIDNFMDGEYDLEGFLADSNIEKHQELFDEMKSPLHLWRVFKGVADVRDAIEDQTKEDYGIDDLNIITDFSPEYDANNSGFVNKLLNALGSLETNTREEIMTMIKTLTVPKKDGSIGDAYKILTDKVEEKIKELDKKATKEKSAESKKEQKLLTDLVAFVKETDGMRNLSKYPLLAGIYGQGEVSLSRNLGMEITKSIMKHGKNEMNKDINEKAQAFLNADPLSVTRSEMRVAAEAIGNIMGKIYTEGLDDLESPITTENKLINDSYKAMESASILLDRDLTLRSVFEVVLPQVVKLKLSKDKAATMDNAEYVYSIMKKKNVVTDHRSTVGGAAETYMTEQKFMPNPNSIRVIPLHAIDTAVMLIAYVKTVAELKRLGYDFGGTMPIHDAVIGSPLFMNVYRDMYNESAFDVAEFYDIKNEVVKTIDGLLTDLKNHKSESGFNISPAAYIEDLTAFKEELLKDNDKRMDQKREDINELRTAGAVVFGTTKKYLGGVNTVSNTRKRTTPVVESSKEESTLKEDTQRVKERKELANKERVNAEKEAHEGADYTIDDSEINTVDKEVLKKEVLEKNNRRIEQLIASEEPYIAFDLETTFDDAADREIVQIAMSIYKGRKVIGKTISEFFLPSDALAYAQKVASKETNNKKEYLPYSTISDNIDTDIHQQIDDGGTDFDHTRGEDVLHRMRELIQEAKSRVNKQRKKDGLDVDTKIPLLGFNSNSFDAPALTNNIGAEYTSDFERLDATYLAEEQIEGLDNLESTGGKFTALAIFMAKNDVEFAEGDTAHDGQADIKAMMDSTFAYIDSKKGQKEKFVEEAGSSSVNDLMNAFRTNSTREEKVAAAIKVIDNMIASGKLSEDGLVSAEELITFLGEGDFDIDGINEKAGNFMYYGETNTIDVTKSLYDVEDVNDVLKYLAHEGEHWASSRFIEAEMAKPKEDRDVHVSFLGSVLEDLLKKMSKDAGVVDKIFGDYDSDIDSFDWSPADRMNYILGKITDKETANWVALSEFVSIYRAEPKFRAMINDVYGDKGKTENKIIASIKELMIKALGKITKWKKEASEHTAQNIAFAMDTITSLGLQQNLENKAKSEKGGSGLGAMSTNEVDMIDESLRYKPLNTNKPAYVFSHEMYMNTWNNAIQRWLKSDGMKYANKAWDNKWTNKFHKKQLKNEEGIYFRTIEAVKARFEPGELFDEIRDYKGLDPKRENERDQLINIWIKAVQDRNRIGLELGINAKRVFNKISRKMKLSKKKISSLNKIFDNSLVHALDETDTDSSILQDVLDSDNKIAKIDEEILKLVQVLDNNIKDAKIETTGGINKYAEDLAKFFQTGVVGDLHKFLNPFDRINDMNQQNSNMTQKLIALHQLKMNGKSSLDMLAEFQRISAKEKEGSSFNEFVGISRSNAVLVWEVDKDMQGKQQYKFDNITGSQTLFNERYRFDAVDETEFNKLISSNEGTKYIVLQKPNEAQGTIGLVASIEEGFGYQAGIASQISINNDGVSVPFEVFNSIRTNTIGTDGQSKTARIIKSSNIIQSTNKGYHDMKIIFTADMLSKLDVNTDPVESLYHAYAHNIEIEHGKSAIKWLAENEITNILTVADAQKLEKRLKKGKTVSYFVNFNIDKKLLSSFPEITRHYKGAVRTTNVYGFNRKVNMVHKSSAYQMVGFKKDPLFHNKRVQKVEKIWRALVTGFKSRVALLSIKKISRDVLSTASILTANDIPFRSIGKYGKEFLKNYPILIKQRNKIIDTEFELYSIQKMKNGKVNPEYTRAERKLKIAKDKLHNNNINPALQRGFIQSLSTTVLTIERENASDYQKMFNEVMGVIEDVPGVKKWAMKIIRFGPGMEDVLRLIKKGTEKGGSASEYLENVANKLEGIKEDKDLAAYMSELFANPGQSEMMKVGGGTVMMIDSLAKWIMYRHFLDMFKEKQYNHLSKQQKEDLAAESAAAPMVKYPKQLPADLQMMSDTGIWIFPQFIIQIQKVIASLFYKRALSSSIHVGMAAAIGEFDHSIFASAVPFKMPSSVVFGQYDGNPLDANMVFPERLASELADPSSLF